jgi:hypothetical protein
MRKTAIIMGTALFALTTVAGGTVAFATTQPRTATQASTGSTHDGTTRVLHLSNHFGETLQANFVDVEPKDVDSIGDVFSGSLDWFRSDMSNEKVCLVGLTATVVRETPEVLLEGTLTAQFRTGYLAFQGLVDFDSDTPSSWVIIGGTGTFLGATGNVVVEGPHVTITVHTPN